MRIARSSCPCGSSTSYTGEPAALDGQRLKWVPPRELAAEDILEADRPFVEALARLPPALS